jgi:hypothetical protein
MVALAAAVVLAGPLACYTTRPLPSSADVTGRRVTLRLTARGSEALGRVLGPEVVRVDGDLIAAPVDSFVLAMVTAERVDGSESAWQRQRVAVARAFVANAEERRLDRHRTWVATAGAIAAAIVAGAGFARGGATPTGATPSGVVPH